jgi:hypothetical protein
MAQTISAAAFMGLCTVFDDDRIRAAKAHGAAALSPRHRADIALTR